MIPMFFPIILAIIIVILLLIIIIERRVMNHKLETESYAKDQLINKISIVTRENTYLKNQMLEKDVNNDTHHHGLRKAKQDLNDILNQYRSQGSISFFDIITTGNLAVKHPLFEYARAFDYIVITEKGLFNINVKNWKQKTFYHFTVDPTNDTQNNGSDTVNQTVGRYIANQFHSQFQSTRPTTYTFVERIRNNSIIYDFYNYDPYEQSSKNAKALEDRIADQLNHRIQNIGLVYFTDGSVNLIDGPTERQDFVETVSSKSSLKEVIGETIVNAQESLTEAQYNELLAHFH